MLDRENVIEGLRRCTEKAVPDCFGCPYSCHCEEGDTWVIKDDALTLLKEQEAIVTCKDCKHRPKEPDLETYKNGFDLEFPDSRCPCECDDGFYSWYPDDNWFCGNGERKG